MGNLEIVCQGTPLLGGVASLKWQWLVGITCHILISNYFKAEKEAPGSDL